MAEDDGSRNSRRRNGATVALLASVVAGMVGLSFASVPLYRLFCQATGFGGTTQRAAAAPGSRRRRRSSRCGSTPRPRPICRGISGR